MTLWYIAITKPKHGIRARKREVLHFRVMAEDEHIALDLLRSTAWGVHLADAEEVLVQPGERVVFLSSTMR